MSKEHMNTEQEFLGYDTLGLPRTSTMSDKILSNGCPLYETVSIITDCNEIDPKYEKPFV